MKKWSTLIRVGLLVSAGVVATANSEAADTGTTGSRYYELRSVKKFTSSNTNWDHIDYDQLRHLAFLSRRVDGVTVVDVRKHQIISQIGNSSGSNSVALVPDAGYGYTSNGDGSTTIFRLGDLKTVRRCYFGTNADANAYDPVTREVIFTQANDGLLTLINPFTGSDEGSISIDSSSPDRPVPDGQGNVFLPLSDKSIILKINLSQRAIVSSWNIADAATQPFASAYDPATNRLFIGCHGDITDPQLVVLDTTTGTVVTTLPLGRGNDGVVFDPGTKRIYTTNGVDGNLVIFQQNDPDTYVMTEAVQTRPGARTIALDLETKEVYTMTAQGLQDPTLPVNRANSFFYPNVFRPNTFVLLTYAMSGQ